MSILVGKETKVICQGITGEQGVRGVIDHADRADRAPPATAPTTEALLFSTTNSCKLKIALLVFSQQYTNALLL